MVTRMHALKWFILKSRLHSIGMHKHEADFNYVTAEDQGYYRGQNLSTRQASRLAFQPVQPLSSADGTETRLPSTADVHIQTAQSCSAQLCH